MWGWVLVRVVAFLASEVVLSPVVSGCLPSCGMGVGWCGHVGWALVGVVAFLGSQVVLSPRCLWLSWPLKWLVSGCLPSYGGGCWFVWYSEVVLSPVVSLHVGWVLVGVVAFLGSQVVLSPVVSGCLCVGVGVGWLKWSCLPLSLVASLHVGMGVGLCGSLLEALRWSCLS